MRPTPHVSRGSPLAGAKQADLGRGVGYGLSGGAQQNGSLDAKLLDKMSWAERKRKTYDRKRKSEDRGMGIGRDVTEMSAD